MKDKKEIRDIMRDRRRQMAANEKCLADKCICQKLISFLESLNSTETIAVYLASKDEINLDEFISYAIKSNHTILAPRWNGQSYELSKIKSLNKDDLRVGPMHILEPKDECIFSPKSVTCWIVPGLAFTMTGNRLGYGGGWYDRLMENSPAIKLGVCYDFQIVASLPAEPHDITLTSIITHPIFT